MINETTSKETETIDFMENHFQQLMLECGNLDLLDAEEKYSDCVEVLQKIRTFL